MLAGARAVDAGAAWLSAPCQAAVSEVSVEDDMENPSTTPTGRMESDFFRALNALMEPAVRAGYGSPGLVPTGLVVLETAGRKSGEPRRVPLVGTLFDGCLFVGTMRGPQSQWMANVRADSRVRYWVLGREYRGRAVVIAPGGPPPATNALPPLARGVVEGLLPSATPFGWSFAVITPDPGGSARE
jgi:deazaflavin-dependent oxidoreductase (nitroreductase family)